MELGLSALIYTQKFTFIPIFPTRKFQCAFWRKSDVRRHTERQTEIYTKVNIFLKIRPNLPHPFISYSTIRHPSIEGCKFPKNVERRNAVKLLSEVGSKSPTSVFFYLWRISSSKSMAHFRLYSYFIYYEFTIVKTEIIFTNFKRIHKI